MEYNKKTLSDLKNLDNQVVLVRCDFNVPIMDHKITDYTRINSSLPTLLELLKHNVKLVLFSHLSRIKTLNDVKSNNHTLYPVYEYLKAKLSSYNCVFYKDNLDENLKAKIDKLPNKSIVLLENTRYADIDLNSGALLKRESNNDPKLGQFWASLGTVFVNDAFGTAHRNHASNVGIANHIKTSAIGFLVEKELKNLSKAMNHPTHPVVAIFGGNKIDDKIATIKNICKFADHVLIGGGMFYGFLKAKGYEIGKSLYSEKNSGLYVELLNQFSDKFIFPSDCVCAKDINDQYSYNMKVNRITPEYAGFDIGRRTVRLFKKYLKNAKTVIWNGPLGAFEYPNFSSGTQRICRLIAKYTSKKPDYYSVIGGGDSAAAAVQFGLDHQISHISTGGGASLKFFGNEVLPGIACINDKTPIQNHQVYTQLKPQTPPKESVVLKDQKVVATQTPKPEPKPVAKEVEPTVMVQKEVIQQKDKPKPEVQKVPDIVIHRDIIDESTPSEMLTKPTPVVHEIIKEEPQKTVVTKPAPLSVSKEPTVVVDHQVIDQQTDYTTVINESESKPHEVVSQKEDVVIPETETAKEAVIEPQVHSALVDIEQFKRNAKLVESPASSVKKRGRGRPRKYLEKETKPKQKRGRKPKEFKPEFVIKPKPSSEVSSTAFEQPTKKRKVFVMRKKGWHEQVEKPTDELFPSKPKRGRGRPKGSKNKKTLALQNNSKPKKETHVNPTSSLFKRGRGRPKGSKNKPKF